MFSSKFYTRFNNSSILMSLWVKGSSFCELIITDPCLDVYLTDCLLLPFCLMLALKDSLSSNSYIFSSCSVRARDLLTFNSQEDSFYSIMVGDCYSINISADRVFVSDFFIWFSRAVLCRCNSSDYFERETKLAHSFLIVLRNFFVSLSSRPSLISAFRRVTQFSRFFESWRCPSYHTLLKSCMRFRIAFSTCSASDRSCFELHSLFKSSICVFSFWISEAVWSC